MGKSKLVPIDEILPLELSQDLSSKYSKFFTDDYFSISCGLFVSEDAKWLVIHEFMDLVEVIKSRGARRGENYIFYSFLNKGMQWICLVVEKLYVSSEDIVDVK